MFERILLICLVFTLCSSAMSPLITNEIEGFAFQEEMAEGMALYVTPQKSVVTVGSTFTINISIANVPSKGPRLWAYEFKLYYNKTVLEGINIELPEGHFLTPKIDPEYIFIVDCSFYQEESYAYVGVMLLAPEPGSTGSGTLVAATFEASLQGNSTIEIRDELLLTPESHRFWPDEYSVINGLVYVVSPDLNSDGEVNIEDLAIVAAAYRSYPGHPTWNPTADVNKDDIINIIDAALIARFFGKCCST